MSAIDITVDATGECAHIVMRGRFAFSAHRAFRSACNTALDARNVMRLQIDMHEVEDLDSAALGMLLLLHERAHARGKDIALVICSRRVHRLLDVAGFTRYFTIT